jgi:hypothetical protein
VLYPPVGCINMHYPASNIATATSLWVLVQVHVQGAVSMSHLLNCFRELSCNPAASPASPDTVDRGHNTCAWYNQLRLLAAVS